MGAMREPETWDKREVVTPTSLHLTKTIKLKLGLSIGESFYMNRGASKILVALVIAIYCSTMYTCKPRPSKIVKLEDTVRVQKQIVNFYIENSGSMKGYFAGNSQIKDVIKEYYDRISERASKGDTITLNYINTEIENSPKGVKDFLLDSENKCTAPYTKIDDILSMSMEDLNDSTVNIVISDYCFTSNNGSFSMAQSGITELFTKRLKDDADLSVAIIKYMSDFNGLYYPGGIRNNKPLPFYLWIFGNESQVKRIVNVPIKTPQYGLLVLQTTQSVKRDIKVKKARMVEDDAIIVKEWSKDRNRESTIYSLLLEMDMSRVILPKEEICDITKYQVTEGYSIESISNKEGEVFSYKITTGKPSPGKLSIAYIQQDLPEWVEKSNYTGTGVPKDSTTLGVKYLIGGVYDAYHNLSNKVFETKITLK